MADTNWVDKVTQFTVAWTQQMNDFVFRGRNPIYATSSGVANVYTVTHVSNLATAFNAGDTFDFKAHQTNIAGASTFNFIASAGTISAPIKLNGANPAAGSILSGQIITLRYDGTNMQLPVAAVRNVAASQLLGNSTGAASAPQDIPLGTGLSFSAGSLQVDFPNVIPTGTVWAFGIAAAPTGWLACDGSAVSRTTYATLFAAIASTFGVGDGTTTFNLPNLCGRVPLGTGTGTYVSRFTSADIDTGTEVITVPVNTSLITGDAVVYTAAAAAAPLVTATTYYVIRLSSTTISLATTLALAQAGTAINLTTTGTGAMTLTVTLTARSIGQLGGEEAHAMSSTELYAHTHGPLTGGQTFVMSAGGAVSANSGGTAQFPTAATTGSTGSNAAMNIMQPWLALLYCIKT